MTSPPRSPDDPEVKSFELADAVRGSWRALIVIVPVVAAIAGGLWYSASSDSQFEATGVLSITEFTQADTPAAVRSVADDLESTLSGSEVAAVVDEIAPSGSGSITAATVGQGSDVRVAFVASDAEQAELALDAGVREALTIHSEIERRQIQRALEAADTESSESIQSLLDIETEAGSANLVEEAARRSADILSLRNQIAAAVISPTVQAELVAVLTEKENELAAIEPMLPPWSAQQVRLEESVQSGAAASLRLQQISAIQEDLLNEPLLQSTDVVETGSVNGALRSMVVAGIVALLVVLAAAYFFSDRWPVRRTDTDDDSAATEGERPGEQDHDVETIDESIETDPMSHEATEADDLVVAEDEVVGLDPEDVDVVVAAQAESEVADELRITRRRPDHADAGR
ncbi:hypothetical protein [Ilumatobacter nonamiensis]|uniref:hypothetical protein n=1 Tax=Ilumatobacter nonamiensis TaxID=467093 RepID=UPI00034976CC|nr:hypothetical protein [Ilumatobacter nonamiensis]